MFLDYIFYLTLFLVVSQFAYWTTLSCVIFFHKSKPFASKKPISLVVCSKNDLNNLKRHLPLWKNQLIENLEIVIVDDYSTDGTDNFLNKQLNLVSLRPNQDLPGKKQALEDGILSSTGVGILVTDADCIPASKIWASRLQDHFDGNNIVLGYGPYIKHAGLLNLFARYETLLTAIQYLSYAVLGKAYMGVGRNMLYPKGLFVKTGFNQHKEIISGHDDLFIQAVAKNTRFEISTHPESFVFSEAPSNIQEYIRQKKRHMSTSTKYRLFHKISLSVNPFLQLMIHGLCLFLAFSNALDLAIFILLFKWVTSIPFLYLSTKKLKTNGLLFFAPILDILFSIYLVFFSFYAFTKTNNQW